MLKFSFKKLPVDEAGKAYNSLEEFQAAQIMEHLEIDVVAASQVVKFKAIVKEILDLTLDARPSARGQKRPRKLKADAQQELPKVA